MSRSSSGGDGAGGEGDGEHIVLVGTATMAHAPTKQPSSPRDARQKWAECMRQEVKQMLDRPWPVQSVGTIFQVPRHLRDLNPDAYEPVAISLGPYHRHPEKHADCHKARYRQDLLSRIPAAAPQKMEEERRQESPGTVSTTTTANYDRIEGAIRKRVPTLEDRVRSCYLQVPLEMGPDTPAPTADHVDQEMGPGGEKPTKELKEMEAKKLAAMLVLDACFVVEFLFKLFEWKTAGGAGGDPVVGDSWSREAVIMDMLLIENQVPFFILREVLDIVVGTQVEHRASPSLFLCLFEGYWPVPPSSSLPSSADRGSSSMSSLVPSVGEPYHLLHFFRRCILPHLCFPDEQNELLRVSPRTIISNATMLEEGGVVFGDLFGDGDACNLRFQNGTMKMPPLTLRGNAEGIFHNLIAFEQCHPASGFQVTSYAMLMFSLVETEEDVALLQRCGVLKNTLGGHDIAVRFFNKLCKQGSFKYNKGKLYADVAAYCKYSIGVKRYLRSRFLAWWAELTEDYLRSPWTVIGVAAAFFLLVLTVLQTVITILSYWKG